MLEPNLQAPKVPAVAGERADKAAGAWRNRRRARILGKERKESEELNIKTSIAWKHKKVKAFTVSLRRHTSEKLAGN